MRKPWISLLLSILVALAVDRTLGYFLGHLLLESHSRLSELYSGRLKSEVLLFGNSRALQGFDAPLVARTIGAGCFNLGYNGLTGEQVEILAKDALEQVPGVRLMVVEVSCFLERAPLETSDLKSYSPYSRRLQQYMYLHSPHRFWACKLSWLYRLNSEIFFRSLAYLTHSDQSHGMAQTITPEVKSMPVGKPLYPSEIGEGGCDALRHLLDVAEKNHVPVQLVLAPYHPTFLPAFADISGLMSDIERKLGHKVTNYAGRLSEDGVFADRLHLNLNGKDRFTRLLISDGIIPLKP